MESTKNTYEDQIIKAVERLRREQAKNPLFSDLVSNLVPKIMSERTLIKYLKNLVEVRKLFRNVDGKKITYEVAPDFFQYIMPSSEEQLSQWIKHLNEYLPQFAKSLLKMSLLDKVLRSADLYHKLRSLCTWHEVEFLKNIPIQEADKKAKLDFEKMYATLNAKDKDLLDGLEAKVKAHAKYYLQSSFDLETFLPLRDELYGLITKLFTVIGKDIEGSAIQKILQFQVLLQEDRLDIPFIKEYNEYVEILERRLKEKGQPMILTGAKGKPLDANSASYSISLKKIPLK